MDSLEYDAVIVGAGTAGSLAALALAERGAKVLLVDSKPRELIGKKVCGDALGVHHIREVLIPFPPKEAYDGIFSAVRVYSPSKKYSVKVEGEGLALNRHAFGQWLLSLALDRGVELRDSTRAETLKFEDNRARELKIVDLKGNITCYVRGKYFIDASGYYGILRRQVPETFGLEKEIAQKDVCVTYREIRRVNGVEEPDVARIFLDENMAPGGYWWYFPKDTKTVNFGVGVQGGRGINPKKNLYEILRKNDILKDSEVIDAGGGIVPTRRNLYTLVAYNVLFAGDAACTANPIHGGGIGPSMLSGRLCGEAVAEALADPENEDERLWEANKRYVSLYGAKAASLDIFRIFLQNLTNDEIEFGMSKGLVTDDDIADIGYGRADFTVREKALKIIRGITRPTMLKNLAETAKYMKIVKQEYLNYPDHTLFPQWVRRVEGIFNEYIQKFIIKS
ncbi:MAG: geranylgeranyl reductase family protein [Nitrososphaeria archaeon]